MCPNEPPSIPGAVRSPGKDVADGEHVVEIASFDSKTLSIALQYATEWKLAAFRLLARLLVKRSIKMQFWIILKNHIFQGNIMSSLHF